MKFTILNHNIKQLLISLDQCVYCLIGFLSSLIGLIIPKLNLIVWADETFSSRCYRWNRDNVCKWPMIILDKIAIIFNDKNHCYNSYLSEQENRQLPPEFRK